MKIFFPEVELNEFQKKYIPNIVGIFYVNGTYIKSMHDAFVLTLWLKSLDEKSLKVIDDFSFILLLV